MTPLSNRLSFLFEYDCSEAEVYVVAGRVQVEKSINVYPFYINL